MLKWIGKYTRAIEFAIHKKMMVEKLSRFESNFKGKVLDVGAGDKPYRYLFTSVSTYISTNTRRH